MNICFYLPKFIPYLCMPIDVWESLNTGVTGHMLNMGTGKKVRLLEEQEELLNTEPILHPQVYLLFFFFHL